MSIDTCYNYFKIILCCTIPTNITIDYLVPILLCFWNYKKTWSSFLLMITRNSCFDIFCSVYNTKRERTVYIYTK